MPITRNIFPLELLNRITKHLDIGVIKKLMASSEVLKEAIEGDPVIWKQQLENHEIDQITNGKYLEAVRRECILTQNWIGNLGHTTSPLVHNPNVEITRIRVYGDIIIVSSNSTYVYVLDKSLNYVRILNKHRGSVWTFKYMDNILVTGSTDKTAKIWDVFLGVCIRTLSEHRSTIRCLLVTEEYVITGSRDSTIRIWSKSTGTCVHVLSGHTGSIRDMTLIKDTSYLVSGSYDGTSILWNYKTGEGVRYLIRLPKRIYVVKSFGKYIAIAGMDYKLHIVGIDGKHIFSGEPQNGTIFQIKIDSEEYLYTLTATGMFSKWDIKRLKHVYEVDTNTKAVDIWILNHLVVVGLVNRIDFFCKKTGRFIKTLDFVDTLYSLYCDNNIIVYGYMIKGTSKISAIRYSC